MIFDQIYKDEEDETIEADSYGPYRNYDVVVGLYTFLLNFKLWGKNTYPSMLDKIREFFRFSRTRRALRSFWDRLPDI
jgi:hypothetical protein